MESFKETIRQISDPHQSKDVEIVETFKNLETALIESAGEISPEMEELYFKIDLTRTEAVDQAHQMIKRLEAVGEYWKDRASESSRIAKSLDMAEQKYRNFIKSIMVSSEKTDLYGIEYRFKLSRAPAKLMINEQILPEEFFKSVTTMVPDREKISAALECGEEVPGAYQEPVFRLTPYPNKKALRAV